VVRTRDSELTDVSPAFSGSTAANDVWYIVGTVASAVWFHSANASGEWDIRVPMTELKTEEGPWGTSMGVGLGAELQGSRPSS
jgi:hypothetical protein